MKNRESDVFGKVPVGVTHWSIRQKGSLSWDWCTFRSADGTEHQDFPIAELSLATIRDRWGAGTYRVLFLSLGRGIRQSHGNGKIFEVKRTPRGAARTTEVQGGAMHDHPAPEDHSEMVRVLLRAAQGKRTPAELFETLAVPLGMGLSSLFTMQERIGERLDAIEHRLATLESNGAPASRDEQAGASRLDRLLDRLEAIERHLAPPPSRKPSPGPRRQSPGRTGRDTPPTRG